MTKDNMIEYLVSKDINRIIEDINNNSFEFIIDILEGNGITPYRQLTDRELNEEYNERVCNDQARK